MGLLYRFFLLLLPVCAIAQNQLKFDRLSSDDGLSNSSVLSIVQDSSGFIWIGTRHGLNRYDTRTIKTFNQSALTGSLSSSDYLNAMLVDSKGILWVGTSSGLNRYNGQQEVFIKYGDDVQGDRKISNNTILSLLEDNQHNIWVGTSNGINILQVNGQIKSAWRDKNFFALAGAAKGKIWASTNDGLRRISYDGKHLTIELFEQLNKRLEIKEKNIKIAAILEEGNGDIWIGTDKNGLFQFNTSKHTLKHFETNSSKGSIRSDNIRKIIRDRTGNLWIGTLGGLAIYDPETDHFTNFQNNPHDPNSLSHNSIYEVFQDKYGSIWIGTYYGGVSIVHPNHTNFNIYQYDTAAAGLSSNIIGALTEDSKGNLWIATEGGGLNYYDRSTGLFKHFYFNPDNPNSINSDLIKSIFLDKEGNLWAGTFQGGLNKYNPNTGHFAHYTHNQSDSTTISSNYVCAILEDSQQRFWVGTGNGLNLFDRAKGTFIRYSKEYDAERNGAAQNITGLFEDKNQTIWVATGGGAYFLTKDSHTFKAVFPQGKDVNFITKDSKEQVWMGTYYDGLWSYDQTTKQIKSYTTTDGLPSDNVLGLLQDNKGIFWVSTSKGLCRFDPDSLIFRNYTRSDGLPSNDFNYNSFFRDRKGRLMFGTYNGLVSFMPTQIKQNKSTPPVQITGLKLFNQTVKVSGEDGLLQKSLNQTAAITFAHNQNVFSLDFAVLNYIKPEKNSYAFMLEGFDKDWNYVSIPTATYTNLPSGDYLFKAKGTNNDGFWSQPVTLKITVLPPFWKTWWAYLIYTVGIAAILFVFLRFLIMRALLKREHEINQLKLNFFTNISHEIRTPLTLITAPLERLIYKTKKETFIHNELLLIKNNTERLLRLVSELMDFRKAEDGYMKLLLGKQDIVAFTQNIYLSFEDMAAGKHIRYHFKSELKQEKLFFDKIQLEKVLFNLLSNAFKFTPDNGEILVQLKDCEDEIQISVRDNGPGISAEEQKKLFTNFYQVQDLDRYHIGSGVGLALSKNIMDLHHGKIELQSGNSNLNQQEYTTFIITLRKGKEHFNKNKVTFSEEIGTRDVALYAVEDLVTPIAQSITTERQYTVLIVEDNSELRVFIARTLVGQYHIMEAANGKEALALAFNNLPDLVVSDVMMPQMDGLELCRYLKTDERTSHIPVILLTARAAYNHHVNGLKTGADLYMVKPFGTELLLLNVANLIAVRKSLQEKYVQLLKLEPTNQPIDNMDKAFLDKLIRIVEDQMENSTFDIPALADKIGMSQPVLYKKVRALTDLSVNDFIKSIRLKRAAQLLDQGQMTIAEIAYAVGFSDRKYFSKEFKKQFGKTPTAYLQE